MICKDWEKGKKIFLSLCIVLVIIMVILGAIILTMKKDNLENLPENGDLDFSGPLYDASIIYDENNQKVTLSDFADKPMALIFFNTTNQESLDALKIFAENEEKYLEKINMAGICISDGISESMQTVKENLSENEILLNNIVYDLDYSAKNEYHISKIPSLVFINKNNEVINTISSDMDEDVITANLDILAENY